MADTPQEALYEAFVRQGNDFNGTLWDFTAAILEALPPGWVLAREQDAAVVSIDRADAPDRTAAVVAFVGDLTPDDVEQVRQDLADGEALRLLPDDVDIRITRYRHGGGWRIGSIAERPTLAEAIQAALDIGNDAREALEAQR